MPGYSSRSAAADKTLDERRCALESLERCVIDRVRQALTGHRVLLTGQPGFKGSWLALWLKRLGAEVTGYALPPPQVSLFNTLELRRTLQHVEADIRDLDRLASVWRSVRPEVVFHLAA